jgi:hypothetical protein
VCFAMLNVNMVPNFFLTCTMWLDTNISQCLNFVFSCNVLLHFAVSRVAVNRSIILTVKEWTGLVSRVKTVVDATPWRNRFCGTWNLNAARNPNFSARTVTPRRHATAAYWNTYATYIQNYYCNRLFILLIQNIQSAPVIFLKM